MQVWIALFRGINVGGNNIVPMADLRALLTNTGLKDVGTYIQSGNAVFKTSCQKADVRAQIVTAVEKKFGFAPRIMLLSLDELKAAVEANPFPDGESDPKTLHLYFMAEAPANPDLEAMTELKAGSEAFELVEDIFYFHAPDGIGRSKLAARVERLLGVDATGRNWRSVLKILEMAETR